jgi:hypothetical protein
MIKSLPNSFGQKYTWDYTPHRKLRWHNFIRSHFLIDCSEVWLQQIIFLLRRMQGLHIVPWKWTGYNMNKFEQSLEWFIQKMIIMSLNLLCSLYIEQIEHQTSHTIYILISHSLLIVQYLLHQPQITTHCTHIIIHLHMPIHFKNSLRIRPHPYIQ